MAQQKLIGEGGQRVLIDPSNTYDTQGKFLNIQKKLLNGSDYVSGITMSRGDIHLRMACFGDSVGGDVAFSVYNKLRGLLGFGGTIYSLPALTGGGFTHANVAETDYWMNGAWHGINGAGSLTFLSAGGRMQCSIIKVYYIKEPSAGTFQVQLDNGSGYVDEGSVVDTNDTLQAGILTITKTNAAYGVRINQVSGNIKIIMIVGINELTNQDSLFFVNFCQGGLQWPSVNTTPRTITNPVFTDLGFDLSTIQFKEGSGIYPIISDWFTDFKTASPLTDWILIGAGPQSSQEDLNIEGNNALKQVAQDLNYFYFDGYHPLIDYNTMNTLGWGGDGVHLSKSAGFYTGAMLWNILGFEDSIALGVKPAIDKSGFLRLGDAKGLSFKSTNNVASNSASIETTGSNDVLIKSGRWLDFRNMSNTQLFLVNNLGDIQVYRFLTAFKPINTGPSIICGTATLSSGQATVLSTSVTSTSRILLTVNSLGGTPGAYHIARDADRVAGTSFMIKAVDSTDTVVTTDTSVINWLIMN